MRSIKYVLVPGLKYIGVLSTKLTKIGVHDAAAKLFQSTNKKINRRILSFDRFSIFVIRGIHMCMAVTPLIMGRQKIVLRSIYTSSIHQVQSKYMICYDD